MNDEVIAKLREKMLHEADKDIEENETGKYAVHKLRMLPEVVEMMQKCAIGVLLFCPNRTDSWWSIPGPRWPSHWWRVEFSRPSSAGSNLCPTSPFPLSTSSVHFSRS